MTRRQYRGVSIESHASGWFSAHVLAPTSGPWGPHYVIVRADTVNGCREAIADVLNGTVR